MLPLTFLQLWEIRQAGEAEYYLGFTRCPHHDPLRCTAWWAGWHRAEEQDQAACSTFLTQLFGYSSPKLYFA